AAYPVVAGLRRHRQPLLAASHLAVLLGNRGLACAVGKSIWTQKKLLNPLRASRTVNAALNKPLAQHPGRQFVVHPFAVGDVSAIRRRRVPVGCEVVLEPPVETQPLRPPVLNLIDRSAVDNLGALPQSNVPLDVE